MKNIDIGLDIGLKKYWYWYLSRYWFFCQKSIDIDIDIENKNLRNIDIDIVWKFDIVPGLAHRGSRGVNMHALGSIF